MGKSVIEYTSLGNLLKKGILWDKIVMKKYMNWQLMVLD